MNKSNVAFVGIVRSQTRATEYFSCTLKKKKMRRKKISHNICCQLNNKKTSLQDFTYWSFYGAQQNDSGCFTNLYFPHLNSECKITIQVTETLQPQRIRTSIFDQEYYLSRYEQLSSLILFTPWLAPSFISLFPFLIATLSKSDWHSSYPLTSLKYNPINIRKSVFQFNNFHLLISCISGHLCSW
jgi:hypothetical protein